jgi:5-methyltetrahydrofolate--homocysteine methyltransferase
VPDILARVEHEVLVVDGAMGTMLMRAGIPTEQCPEQLNVTAPDIVREIHTNYRLAGADCVTTNTFGGTRAKLDAYGLGDQVVELNRAGVAVARESGAVHVLGDVGPSGLVLEPLGEVAFDDAFVMFAEQVEALASAGPDAILIETMTDIAEARCALLAARSVTDLPVFVTMTFGLSGRTDLSGTPPEAAVVTLEACGAAAVGANCGIGPEQMLPIVEEIAAATALPVIVQPNAGLPRVVDGETVFPGTEDEMGEYAARFVAAGTNMVGSCCGSTPGFTGSIADFAGQHPVSARERPEGLALASTRGAVRLGGRRPIALIGERINPTGKPRLSGSLREGSMSVVRELAVDQQHDGADLLDVNVGTTGVDTAEALPAAVRALSGLTDLPLVLDDTDPAALEAALKAYPGRALVNSVNGSSSSIESILPIAARYGAAVLVLALDDDGIPPDAEGRLRVAAKVREAAHAHGLADSDLAVDCIVMTAATDPASARATLDAIAVVSDEWAVATVLGVSNVSHGLPGRAWLNSAFLAMAASAGLSAAIMNPSDLEMMRGLAAANLLSGRDERAERWIAWTRSEAAADTFVARTKASAGEAAPGPADGPVAEAPRARNASVDRLATAVETGDSDAVPRLVDEVLADGTPPERVIADVLTPAIQRLGDAFGRGEVFLPQLMVAAESMKVAVERVERELPASEAEPVGRVVFATVEGDVHSIGKDICVSLLESAGFDVRDLGVDVPTEAIVEGARDADAVCLSALMTTTLPAVERTVQAVRSEGETPVVIGGAVVTADYAETLGVGYATDAPGCVDRVLRATSDEEVRDG